MVGTTGWSIDLQVVSRLLRCDVNSSLVNADRSASLCGKKRTLTNLYNARPTWLAQLHERLDRAVWAAYGWDDPDPATVEEDTILSRLLALNLERAAGES